MSRTFFFVQGDGQDTWHGVPPDVNAHFLRVLRRAQRGQHPRRVHVGNEPQTGNPIHTWDVDLRQYPGLGGHSLRVVVHKAPVPSGEKFVRLCYLDANRLRRVVYRVLPMHEGARLRRDDDELPEEGVEEKDVYQSSPDYADDGERPPQRRRLGSDASAS